MKISYSQRFLKNYQRLPKDIQKKVAKQIHFIQESFFHPSLKTKKMKGYQNVWEFRVSRGYRMTAEKTDNELVLRIVGSHDEGLGKK